MNFLVYALWEPKDGIQKWDIRECDENAHLNNGKPWLCFSQSEGLTGVMGMTITADTEEEAKQKMIDVITDYKRRDKEPNVWH